MKYLVILVAVLATLPLSSHAAQRCTVQELRAMERAGIPRDERFERCGVQVVRESGKPCCCVSSLYTHVFDPYRGYVKRYTGSLAQNWSVPELCVHEDRSVCVAVPEGQCY